MVLVINANIYHQYTQMLAVYHTWILWYINANIWGKFDWIHGAPYIAAPLGSVMGMDVH